ncbi:MAG TPA: putative peptide maturation dehydrogenase [Solirubrobacteraceae bacterium]
MANVRRTIFAFYYLEDELRLDPAALLRGDLPPPGPARVRAVALLTGERHRLEPAEFEAVSRVPATRWIADEGLDRETLRSLTAKGLVLTDGANGRLAALRERDEALAANEWNVYAAAYHYMTQWSGVEGADGEVDTSVLRANAREAARSLVERHGPPPGPFADFPSGPAFALPAIERDGQLYDALRARRTTRAFDMGTPMTVEQLDTVLRYVFGCHGYATNTADVVCIKRTSPSGGGLHPVEVYPVVSNVAGVDPGIYHYNARDHSLVALEALDAGRARGLATAFMAGQSFFGDAHVSFVLSARYYRNHWKYRRHDRSYAGILMDAAHLSQTLYLVSADLKLGAFVTLAINGRDIEQRVGLDGVAEGVVAMAGCGPRDVDGSPLELAFAGPVNPDSS